MDDQRLARLAHELGDLDLAERSVRARREVVTAVPEHVAHQHLTAMLAASPSNPSATAPRGRHIAGRMVHRSAGLAVAVMVTALVVVGGLAAVGSLPAGAQDLVADVVSHVGVELPRPATTPPAVAPTPPPARSPSPPPAREPGERPRAPVHELRGGEDAPGREPRDGPGTDRRDDSTGSDSHGMETDVESDATEPSLPDRSGPRDPDVPAETPGRDASTQTAPVPPAAPAIPRAQDRASSRAPDPVTPPDEPADDDVDAGPRAGRSSGVSPAGR